MTSTDKRERKKQRSQRIYTYILMKNQNEIGTKERRRRQKKNVRHQINTTIKKQQLAREKGKNRDHKEYTYILMKNQNEIGTEERRRRKKKNVRHQIIIKQLARKRKNRDHKEYILTY